MSIDCHKVTAVHLDAIGGIAGDMFAAAILDAFPHLWPACQTAIESLPFDQRITARVDNSGDAKYKGARFIIDLNNSEPTAPQKHNFWLDIRRMLEDSNLDDDVQNNAINIFSILADAEAAVHDISAEKVTFHEVGAIDSIIDIVVAAVLIKALTPCEWFIGPLPRGQGQIKSQHGYLPLPAPASARILEGFVLFDDGEEGERITPTGAAILKYLKPEQTADRLPRLLLSSGMGFGKNQLQSRPNVLRASFYGGQNRSIKHSVVHVLRCEIDDQTGEDLAIAIEHLRAIEGVLDVCQWPIFAKKGRIATALQVLADPDRADKITIAILNETETLGIRQSIQHRQILQREETKVEDVRVKLARRPDGISAKAEIDDVAMGRSVMSRKALRQKAEARAKEEIDDKTD